MTLTCDEIIAIYGADFEECRARPGWTVGKIIKASGIFDQCATRLIDGPHGVANIEVHDDDPMTADIICAVLNRIEELRREEQNKPKT